jgi:hypothetical protein
MSREPANAKLRILNMEVLRSTTAVERAQFNLRLVEKRLADARNALEKAMRNDP